MADTTKNPSSKPATASKARREQARRSAAKPASGWRTIAQRPSAARGLLIGAVFTLVIGAIVGWAREQPIVAVGQIMTSTRLVRTDFKVIDEIRTQSQREIARQRATRVYRADNSVFEDIKTQLDGLPKALADADTLVKVAPEIRDRFQLTPVQLDALRAYAQNDEASEQWSKRLVPDLIEKLRYTPLLDRETWQIEQQEANRTIELRFWSDLKPITRNKDGAVNVEGARLEERIAAAVHGAGFEAPIDSLVIGWLVRNARPTFVFDEEATRANRDADADAAPEQFVTYTRGREIYRRGDVLTQDQREIDRLERAETSRARSIGQRWLPRLGALLATILAASGVGFYLARFCPRITRNPMRVFAIASIVLVTTLIAAWATIQTPTGIAISSTAPTIFIAFILVIAYDQRTALAISSLQALLVGVALHLPAEVFITVLAGVGVAVWKLGEIRQRNTIMRAGAWTAAALAGGTLACELLTIPQVQGAFSQTLTDAGYAAVGGVGVAMIIYGVLPFIERTFDITTGMTLIELRDPRNPLLREMQSRAPGTYNHSLSVATLAEAAAEKIGADALHLYVGALYHDIGKINKPDYFVENQSEGVNKHAKLSPAMSLLVIVGHVKDGVELAREHNLPRSLHHYIESHHGTTLVEYFYHQARQQADEAERDQPSEIEYRYPGPKPRTREAAILMICDAVESATRAMPEPTPSRIETLVHKLATKRLMDGQFDECDLTLADLHAIEASLTKGLISMHHARVAYPEASRSKPVQSPHTQPDLRLDSDTKSGEKTATRSA
ncbi:MAG: HDIG domain-containing protein [Phycisphaeraceae bacterium]|nr:HDIG domain-containing protein [Phycisphaeraceae bacterium]MCB9847219.1 HDIG domain-containing protein [Phycisphaeraceae bacterium]